MHQRCMQRYMMQGFVIIIVNYISVRLGTPTLDNSEFTLTLYHMLLLEEQHCEAKRYRLVLPAHYHPCT